MRRAVKAVLSTIAAIPLLAGCATDRSDGANSTPATGETPSSPMPTSQTPITDDQTTDAPVFPRGHEASVG